ERLPVGWILPDRRFLVSAEEKQPVLQDGTADCASELVALQSTAGGCKIVSCVEEIITKEVKRVSVKLIRSGFGHGAYRCAFAVLRRQSARFYFEFLEGVGKWQR